MIELFINDLRVDLYENVGIGTTFQTANLINLNARGGSYTNKFKVPLTAINKSILENAQIVNSDTNYPYEFNTASISIDGVMVLADGVAFVEATGDDSLVIYVLSGNSDFFNLIKGVNLSDLDFSQYNHTLSNTDLTTYSVDVTSGLVYPFLGFTDNEADNAIDEVNSLGQSIPRAIRLGECLPAMFVDSILDAVESYTGWKIEGTLRTNTEFLKLCFLANNFIKEYDDKDNTVEYTTASPTTIYTASSKGYATINETSLGTPPRINFGFNTNSSTMTITNDIILCDKTANYEFDFNLDVDLDCPVGEETRFGIMVRECDSAGTTHVGRCDFYSQEIVYFYDSGFQPYRKASGLSTQNIQGNFQGTFYMESGKYYSMYLYSYENTTSSTAGSYVSTVTMNQGTNFLFKETSTLYPLDDVDANLLYTFDLTTFFKDLIQMFGLNLQANNFTKTLTLNYFNDLADADVEDWTSKVNTSKGISLSYKYGNYAQVNNAQYNTSDELIDGSFAISNLTLANEKTAIKVSVDGLPLNYDYTVTTGGNYTNAIAPIFDVEERISNLNTTKQPTGVVGAMGVSRYQKIEDGQCYFFRGGAVDPVDDTHAFNLIGGSAVVGLPNSFLNGTLSGTFGRFRVGSSAGLGFDQLIPLYYQPIIDMFTKTKVVTAYLDLSPVDILNLDFSKPKKLINERMNDNFYLLKVSNYKAGQSTKCTFIRL